MNTLANAIALPPGDANPGPTDQLRVMLVDDSIVARAILERIINDNDDMQVVASLPGAADALDALAHTQVDVIVLDIEMPGMSGITALPMILQKSGHARVIILSANCDDGGPAAIEALALGAADTLLKPGRGSFAGQFGATLVARLRALVELPAANGERKRVLPTPVKPRQTNIAGRRITAIAIGASTGGIMAINTVLGGLSLDVAAPIFVTQHLPTTFIPYFAGQLDRAQSRPVIVADDGMAVEQGHVYVAPGDGHLTATRVGETIRIVIDRNPVANGALPSVDPMMTSVAQVYEAGACGITLSGMGRDGLIGTRHMQSRGGLIIAQDCDSSVVWGMPGSVAREQLAQHILNPFAIAELLNVSQRGLSGRS